MNIAHIVCDHGLGHHKRSILNGMADLELGHNVDLIGSRDAVMRLMPVLPSYTGLSFIEARTETHYGKFERSLESILKWLDRLPSLKKYDRVISDNLPEILLVQEHAVISAQFFWHEIIPNVNKEYRALCDFLLKKCKPKVTGCPFFSMPHIKGLSGYIPKYLPQNPLIKSERKKGAHRQNSLLFTCGSQPHGIETMAKVFTAINSLSELYCDRIYVDPQLYNDLLPLSRYPLEIADYSASMFARVSLSFCRPGLGIVSDLLAAEAGIIPVSHNDNLEMNHNSSVISRYYAEMANIRLHKHGIPSYMAYDICSV